MRSSRSPPDLGFTRRDRQRLKAALEEVGEARIYRRLLAVYLVSEGWSVDDVAQLLSCSRTTIYCWLDRYLCSHSLDALGDLRRSGRPPVARSLTRPLLLQELQHLPFRVHLASTCWTIPLLRVRLKARHGIEVSDRTLRRRLHGWHLRWKRPRYVYATKDPHRAQKKGA